MKKRRLPLMLIVLLAAALAITLIKPRPASVADDPSQELTLRPGVEEPENASTPSPQSNSPDSQAPPAAEPSDDPGDAEPSAAQPPAGPGDTDPPGYLSEDGTYTSKEDVALYIHLYGHLPDNFITKREAQELGWSSGSLEPYAPGKCIGGNRFGNYEGVLPEAEGRSYTECDIDTLGAKKRGAKRIVFSNDGLIYYTEDHYQTFELLYGEE